uniref:Troponin I, skeletal, slow c n=1 Tax=Salarias fasciatus TaxID=181472 RepID=A0A672IKF5_SALFA
MPSGHILLLLQPKCKISASRKLSLKILLLTRAMEELEAEKAACEEEKVRYLGDKLPPLQLNGLNMEELQNIVKQMHSKIETVDEERYDCEAKVIKNYRDINELKLKVQDLGGKFKKPALRKVRVSADEMMRALFGSRSKESMDLRANLKSVKKEDIKQEKVWLHQHTNTQKKPQKSNELNTGFDASGTEHGGG